LGHTECGAVSAAISGPPLEGYLRQIQMQIRPIADRVKAEHPDLTGEALKNAVIRANALQSRQDMLDRSPGIRDAVAAGRVVIVAAVYDLETGAVEWIE
jgi:carbonic anhydrase